MSTLPIYWPESVQFGDMLSDTAEKSRVRQILETRFTIEPLDALAAEQLEGMDRLILAQPRALSAEENVTLDEWVRNGGRVLVFADPMLTAHSGYSIGDPRRPQDVALLSPILARWGLTLEFSALQPRGERLESAYDREFLVNLAGRFREIETEAPSDCIVSETGLLAQCRIGDGRATLFADAAILEEHDESDAPEQVGDLDGLIAAALDF